MRKETRHGMPEHYQFVHVITPHNRLNHKQVSQIRSHVTKLQHFRSRTIIRRRVLSSDYTTVKAATKRSRSRKRAAVEQKSAQKRLQHTLRETGPDSPQPQSGQSTHQPCCSHHLPYASIADHRTDPFDASPVEHHPLYDKLLHHMLTVFAPRAWSSMRICNAEGQYWTHFMTQQALTEPSLYFVRLFFATGDLIRLKQLDPVVAVWLRSLAIQEINAALSDSNRRVSDGLILAVGRIALAEALYGHRAAAISVHRPAWKTMIDMRGGLANLAFPALVKRMMRWSDIVMAAQNGVERILDEPQDTCNNFSINDSMEILEQWHPEQALVIRQKDTVNDIHDLCQ